MAVIGPLQILDPVVMPSVKPIVLAPRLHTLAGRSVGLYSNGKTNASAILDLVGAALTDRFGVAELIRAPFNMDGSVDDSLLGPDAAILAIGD
jgi:hypothetical protein